MEILRSVLGAPDPGAATVSSADTIERLVERVNSSTLLADRRDACRGLKAMSKKFRLEVGAQGLQSLILVLKTDQTDSEIISYVMETLANIFSPEEFEDESIPDNSRDDLTGIGEGFSEMFLKNDENLPLLLGFLEEFDFKIRRPCVQTVNYLLSNCPREIQNQILNCHSGVSKLMDILGETREVLRNDALILLFKLTKGNSNIQKIVAFENAFDKLMEIMEFEGWTDGGIVVEDCLRLLLNLLRNNPSNQTFFKEGSYVNRLLPSLVDSADTTDYGWDAQKVANMLHILQLVRTLVAPSNPSQITQSCQVACYQSGLLSKLEEILMASGIPADVLTETINTIAELIRGSNTNQEQFLSVCAPSEPPRPALILLLMSMVNDKQPFSLRCSVLYCVQSYLYKNNLGQSKLVESLLPKDQQTGDVSAGQLLCGGLFSADPVSNWLCAAALSQVFSESTQLREELLRVQLATQVGAPPVSLLTQSVMLLQHNATLTTRLGLLQLLCNWIASCPTAVAALLQVNGAVPFLMAQVCSNEHDETERLGHGLCAFLLGLCMIYNSGTVPGLTGPELISLVEKRVGSDLFLDKIADIPKHESFNKALKSPQLRCGAVTDLIVDNLFCNLFRSLDRDVTAVIAEKKKNNNSLGVANIDQSTTEALDSYKMFIREQDAKIKEYMEANTLLHTELVNLQSRFDELSNTVQQLRDQNAIYQAQALNSATSAFPPQQQFQQSSGVQPAPNSPQQEHGESQVDSLLKQISHQEEYIQELEARLVADDSLSSSSPPPASTAPPHLAAAPPTQVDARENLTQTEPDPAAEMLRKQLESMRTILLKKDAEIFQLRTEIPTKEDGKPMDRFENMFLTSLELEAKKNKERSVDTLQFELSLKEKEIDRINENHEVELGEVTRDRNRLEMELYKTRQEVEELRLVKFETSREVVDNLERRLREARCELEEVREERDKKSTAVSSNTGLLQDVISDLKAELVKEKEKVESLNSEQEDLLVMLSDQEEKMAVYKTRLRELNLSVSDEEDGGDEDGLDEADLT